MNSKTNKFIETTQIRNPQKDYIGSDQAQRRRLLRDHLFSGRLATLAHLYKGRPLPLFEKPKRLVKLSVDYFGKNFDLLLSMEDSWSQNYIDKLSKLSRCMDYQFSIVGSAAGAIFGAFGLSNYMSTVFNTFIQSLSANMLSAMMGIGILLKSDDTFIQCQAMGVILTNLGMSFKSFASIAWPLLPAKLFFQSNDKPFSWIPSAVGVLMTVLLGGCTLGQYLEIFQRTSNMGYTMGTVTSLSKLITEAISELVPYVYKVMTGRDWHVEQLATNMTLFTDFTTQVEDFERHRLCNLESDWQVQKEVYILQTKYKELLMEAQKLGLSRTLTPLVSNYYQKIALWVKRVAASGILLAGHRAEPLSILISGKPGMGKSYIVNELVRDIGGEDIKWGTIPGETIANHIYVRNPQEAYWSGYRGQFATVYDDFGQIADTESTPDPEFLEIIQAVGDNPYKIPMADIEEKNRGYFRSPVIIATTNLTRFGSTVVKSIRSPTALARRFDLNVEMLRGGESRIFQLMIDGEPRDKIDYVTLVNMARSYYRIKQEKYVRRSTEAQVKETQVEHVCMAQRINILSAPSSIEGTNMRRTPISPDAPNHTYCHHSLSCRIQTQGILEWLGLRSAPTSMVDRKIYYGQVIWEPRIVTYLNLSTEQKEMITSMQDEIEALLVNDNEQNEVPLWDSEDWMRFGPRTSPMWDNIKRVASHLMAVPLNVKISVTQEHIVKTLTQDAIDILAADGLLPLSAVLEVWGSVLFGKIIKVLQRLGGLFMQVTDHLMAFIFSHPVSALFFLSMTPFLFQQVVKSFGGLFVGEANIEEKVDKWEDRLSAYWELQEKLHPQARKEGFGEKDMKRLQTNVKAKLEQLECESKPDKGNQRSNKVTSMKIESKPEKGNQRSNKVSSMKMESTGLPPSLIDDRSFINMDFLTLTDYGAFKAVGVDPSVIDYLAKFGTDDFIAEYILVSFHEYAKFLLAACDGCPMPIQDFNTHLVDFYLDVYKKMGIKPILQSTLATDREKKIFQSDSTVKDVRKYLEAYVDTLSFEGSADQNADGISRALAPNLLDIKATGALGRASQIFFYAGRRAWCNKHTWERMEGTSVTIERTKRNGEKEPLVFNRTELKAVIHPALDLVILEFPKTLAPFPNLLKHIIKDEDLNFSVLPAIRVVTRREAEMLWLQSPSAMLITETKEEAGIMIPKGTSIGYTGINTVVGDCGAPVLIMDPARQRKVCGMHFLGNSFGAGQAVLLTQELIISMEEAGDLRNDMEYQHNFTDLPDDVDTMLDFPLGIVPTPFEPSKTKVRRSVIHGEVSEPTTRPSILKPINGLDPMDRGVNELQKPKHVISESFQEQAKQVLTRYTSGEVLIARTLTLEEALTAGGIPGLEPIDIKTSAGLPLCLEPGANGKRKWINEERQPTLELVKMINDFIGEIKQGELSDIPIFKETLKDERVKLAKADINDPDKIKTRLFSACPLKLLVALRMYFGAFMAHAVRNQIRNTCTSGTNPHGSDWHMISSWLHEVSDLVDDGDYSCFDTSQPSGFLKVVYDAIREWYKINGGTDEDDLIRERLAELCYHPFRSKKGQVYRTMGCLPSGMFGTTQINSGTNLVAFFFAFKSLYPDSTTQDFLDNVRTVTHGDDVLFSVSRDFEGFTSENIGQALKQVGMVFTPADKGGIASQARPIEDTTFLKRGFKKIHGIYRAPLDVKSSLEMCNWITKTTDVVTATKDNCAAAMRELAISEDNTHLQERIQSALYNSTNGRIFLPIYTREDAINDVLKHF